MIFQGPGTLDGVKESGLCRSYARKLSVLKIGEMTP
jgi:hypothetical protein